MSHFSSLKTQISNTELLIKTLTEDFHLKPKIHASQLIIRGSQFNCGATLYFQKGSDGLWQIEGDLYYVDRSRLGGQGKDFRQELLKAYTRRLIQQQIEANGFGWQIVEEKQTPQGATFVVTGANGEMVEATLSRAGLLVEVGNTTGVSCVELTSHLSTAFELQEQQLKQEYYETEENYYLTEQYQ